MGKKVLVAIVIFLAFFALLYVFLRIAIDAVPNAAQPTITLTSFYLASIPTLFLFLLFISFFLAMQTWRAVEKKPWKKWWNVVEVIWIVGGGLGIFGIVSAQTPAFRSRALDIDLQSIGAQRAELSKMAVQVVASSCIPTPIDTKVCGFANHLTAISARDLPIRWIDFLLTLNRYVRAHRDQALQIQPFYKLLDAYDELEQMDVAYDLDARTETSLGPAWVKWFAILAPQVFAIIFPLRMGRAIAAFGL